MLSLKKSLLTACAAVLAFGAAPAFAYNGGSDDKAEKASMEKPADDVVGVAMSNPDFSTLVAALKAADLVTALQGEGPFTVFAPTNDAFAALPEGTLDNLLKPENKDQLTEILTYHVVPAKLMAGDIPEGESEVDTLKGTTLNVVKNEAGVLVNGVNVINPNIETSNGVIHVIGNVIIPE